MNASFFDNPRRHMEHLKFHMELITNSLRSCVRIDLRTSAKIQQHQLLGPAIALKLFGNYKMVSV